MITRHPPHARVLRASIRQAGLALLLFLLVTGTGSAQGARLTGGPLLAAAYDAIFDARFDDVPALLTTACPSGATLRPPGRSAQHAPPDACQLLDAVAIWWRIQLNPNDRSRDEEFRTRADEAIAAIDEWTTREPMRAEAWFYLGGAYGARAQWRVLRGERLSAARDGKGVKRMMEMVQSSRFGVSLMGLGIMRRSLMPTSSR